MPPEDGFVVYGYYLYGRFYVAGSTNPLFPDPEDAKGHMVTEVPDSNGNFVKRKSIKTVLHSDVDSLTIEGCGNCYLNEDYEKGFVNFDSKETFQGAMIALICMLSFEAQPDRDRIRII